MSTIDVVGAALGQRQRELDREVGEAKALLNEGKRVEGEVARLQTELESCEKAILVLQSFGEERQRDLQLKIETLITHGLRTIFGDDMSFHILQKSQGKLAAMDFVIRSTVEGATVETSIMDARGGGVAAIAGFLLRLIVLLLSKSKADPVLLMDESFAQLSAEYEPRLADFLRELVDKTAAQIVLVTHSDAFNDAADKVYRFTQESGVTRITEN